MAVLNINFIRDRQGLQWYLRNHRRQEVIMGHQKSPTMPVPAAGRKYFGLGRNASYAAAARGEIPAIRIGRRIFAVVAALERKIAEAGQINPEPPTK